MCALPLLSSSGFAPRLSLWECAPCAIWRHHLCHTNASPHSRKGAPSYTESAVNTPAACAVAQMAVEAAAGAVLLGGARTVVVPSALVSYLETRWQWADACNVRDARHIPPAHLGTASSGPIRSTASGAAYYITKDYSLPSAAAAPSACAPLQSIRKSWRALQSDDRLVVLLSPSDASHFVSHFPHYTQFCVLVPGGALAAQRHFATSLDAFYRREVPRLVDTFAAAGPRHGWYAWMRGALTCRFEGTYKFPITLAELTTQLLRAESRCWSDGEWGGGDAAAAAATTTRKTPPVSQRGRCRGVVWESAIAGMTPRWLETTLKTVMSCGLSSAEGEEGVLTLALPSAEGSGRSLMYKALDMRVTQFATCSLRNRTMFDDTHSLATLEDAMELVVGCNDGVDGGVSVEEEGCMAECRSFVNALNDTWQQQQQQKEDQQEQQSLHATVDNG